MPTTDTRDMKALKKTISHHKDTISDLRDRINSMTDDIFVLRKELNNFKKNVASDINELFENRGT